MKIIVNVSGQCSIVFLKYRLFFITNHLMHLQLVNALLDSLDGFYCWL